jgi:hypothetical protein
MQDLGQDPSAFKYWWAQLQFVFDVTDPRSFGGLPEGVGEAQRRLVTRYIETARVLATSAQLSAPDHVTFTFERETDESFGESIEPSFSPPDVMAGFSVYFRQCYADKETANFNRVMAILNAAKVRASQASELRRWGLMVKHLRAKSLQQLLLVRLHEEGLWPPLDESDRAGFQQQSPERIIGEYFYGDHIHWDRQAEVVESRRESAFLDAWHRMAFRDATSALAHAYIGFAVLAEHALESS